MKSRSWFRWAKQVIDALVSDLSGSTFTTTTWNPAANSIATATLTLTTKDGSAVAVPGVPVTFEVSRITLSTDDCFVTTDKTDIDSTGSDVCTVSVQIKTRVDGELVGVPNVPASAFVIAVSGTGNTITQPASATNADGVTTGSFVSTEAAATKTVTVTALGLTLLTATVTTDGGYVAPTPGDPFFSDNFASGSKTDDNGFTWNSTGSRVTVSSDRGYGGSSYSLRFRFGPDATGADSSAEQRFNMGVNVTHLWLEYQLWVPSNFSHRNDPPQNNKFALFWREIYSDPNTWRLGWEYSTNSGTTPNSFIRGYSSRWNYNSQTDYDPYGDYAPTGQGSTLISGSGPIIPGQWNQIRIELKTATNASSSDGIQRMWANGTQVFSITTGKFWNYPTGAEPSDCVLRNGYLLGWSNSGFTSQTDFYIGDVKFYNSDPQW